MNTRFRRALLALNLVVAPPAFLTVAASAQVPASAEVMAGGAPMYANKGITANPVNLKDPATLVAAVKAAGLVETLKGSGPYMGFTPPNAAFTALPAQGVMSHVRIVDMRQGNGMVHVVDHVPLPG